jgi:hypothetical protein
VYTSAGPHAARLLRLLRLQAEPPTTAVLASGLWMNPSHGLSTLEGNDPDMVYATGRCVCDNTLVNFFADTIVEALPIIAQVCLLTFFRVVIDL